VNPGATITYTITYGNVGLGEARNVVIVETLPPGLTYVDGSASNGGVYVPAGRTITWTRATLAAKTTEQTVTFEAQVSAAMLEGGVITNSSLTIDSDEETPAQSQVTPETTTVNDQKGPQLSGQIPAPGAEHVPQETLIQLHVTDAGTGVDYGNNTVRIYVEGDLVYDGSAETDPNEYDSTLAPDQLVRGICRRTGTPADYTFTFLRVGKFGYEQDVTVRVTAADLDVNLLNDADGVELLFHDY
ncbi:MAG: DUF11 domain-containing protein, partial [Planctomycetes bacterium]|nr:DUF11 domain-containing protein [Planctomycetota bacterium]